MELISPFYHSISNNDLSHIWPLYKVYNETEFIHHLDVFSKTHDFISANDLLRIIQGDFVEGKRGKIFLSFDDGLKECNDIVAPILKEKGIPATFFVNPAFIDTDDVFYRYKVALMVDRLQYEQIEQTITDELKFILSELGKLKYTLEDSFLSMNYNDLELIDECMSTAGIKAKNKDIYLSAKEIKKLADDGFSIGGHSMSHAHFDLLTEVEQLAEIKNSVDFCQKHFNQNLRLFAFPFYDFNLPRSLFQKMYNELRIDLSFGTSGLKKDVFSQSIQRLDMEQIQGDVSQGIRKEKWKYRFQRLLNKHIIRRS